MTPAKKLKPKATAPEPVALNMQAPAPKDTAPEVGAIKPLGQFETVKNATSGNEYIVLGRTESGVRLSIRMSLKATANAFTTWIEYRIRIGDKVDGKATAEELVVPHGNIWSGGTLEGGYRSILGSFQSGVPAGDHQAVWQQFDASGFSAGLYLKLKELFPQVSFEVSQEGFRLLMRAIYAKISANIPKPEEKPVQTQWRLGDVAHYPESVQKTPKKAAKESLASSAGL